MENKFKLTKTKIIIFCLLVVILMSGTTYALVKWASENVTISNINSKFIYNYEKSNVNNRKNFR